MADVGVYNARAEFSRLIERALADEDNIVITRRGKPVIRLVPVEPALAKRKPQGAVHCTRELFRPLAGRNHRCVL